MSEIEYTTLHKLMADCGMTDGSVLFEAGQQSAESTIADLSAQLATLQAEIAALRNGLEKARSAIERARPAFTNLTTNQRQLDQDGCEVGVSRQAIDETVDAILEAADALLASLSQQATPPQEQEREG